MPCIEEVSDHNLSVYYPSFEHVVPPPRSNAIRAWKGRIVPFPDSSGLGKIVEDLDRDATVDIDIGGSLRHGSACGFNHAEPPYLSRLVQMNIDFEVLVLEFEGRQHRQTYCLKPEISSRTFPTHPHLRCDQKILTDIPVEAVCPYRSDEASPKSLVEYLDFVSIYLAKHLVWVRTLDLLCYRGDGPPRIVYSPMLNFGHFSYTFNDAGFSCVTPAWQWPAVNVKEHTGMGVAMSHVDRWEGTWLGPSAPHDPATVLDTVRPDDECVCGMGTRYGSCCRKKHLALLNEATRASELVFGRKRR